MNEYITVLKKYAVFQGRANRKEYWMFVLINFIVSFAIGFASGMLAAMIDPSLALISTVYSLAVMIPSIAVGVRRMHDTNNSGWFLLIPLYNLYLAIKEGDRGDNRFGPDPRGSAPAPATA
jgi:uncharacterized membrane protein YhaH (DUF805 family)